MEEGSNILMISNLISKTDCAKCEFCCTFYRNEIWEAPRFSKEILPEIKKICPEAKFKSLTETTVTQELADLYKTDDAKEIVLCYFNKNGYILPDQLKPFECKIWPFRIMRKDNKTVMALSTSCPTINMCTDDEIKATIENLSDNLRKYVRIYPETIKEYHEGYKIISSLT